MLRCLFLFQLNACFVQYSVFTYPTAEFPRLHAYKHGEYVIAITANMIHLDSFCKLFCASNYMFGRWNDIFSEPMEGNYAIAPFNPVYFEPSKIVDIWPRFTKISFGFFHNKFSLCTLYQVYC